MNDYWEDKPKELKNLCLKIIRSLYEVEVDYTIPNSIEAYTDDFAKKLLRYEGYRNEGNIESILTEFNKTLL